MFAAVQFGGGSARPRILSRQVLRAEGSLRDYMGFGKDGKGSILYNLSRVVLSTLGSESAIEGNTEYVGSLQDDFRVISAEVHAVITGG